MGFIGTVIGIGSAVGGFSTFLQRAEEIDQIKQGISGVTTGLAVAFDTTLVALALSIVAMIPLVLIERWEARILARIDAFVTDSVVALLPEQGESGAAGTHAPAIDAPALAAALGAALKQPLAQAVAEAVAAATAATERTVRDAVAAHLPTPDQFVAAAQEHLRTAALAITDSAQRMAAGLEAGTLVLQQSCDEAASRLAADQQARSREFSAHLTAQTAALHASLREVTASAADALGEAGASAAAALRQGSQQAAGVLADAANALDSRVQALTEQATRLNELAVLERTLTDTLAAATTAADLRRVLGGVDVTLSGLAPALDRLAQPRQLVFMESLSAATAGRPVPAGHLPDDAGHSMLTSRPGNGIHT
jgi:hypothetical protein